MVLPDLGRINLTFRFRNVFRVTYIDSMDVPRAISWEIASDILHLRDGESWLKVEDGVWRLNYYADGSFSVAIDYLLNGKDMHVDLIPRVELKFTWGGQAGAESAT